MTAITPILESVLMCPQCGHAKLEVMPTNACQFFYECEHGTSASLILTLEAVFTAVLARLWYHECECS